MDVTERIAAGLPRAVEELEPQDQHDVSELWLLARAYSRLRHKAPSVGHERERLERLKLHCLRTALAREPEQFLVMVDPGLSHLRLIYHRVERNLLHVPVTVDLATNGHGG